jgi:methylated-DNA-[protein]-cysteine S-methyltransferase
MKDRPVYHISTFKTPAGPFTVAVDRSGAIAATSFGGERTLREYLPGASLVPDEQKTAAAREDVESWFRGEKREFTSRLSPTGTPYQLRVWAELSRIPFGETRSYGAIAKSLGSSARAVGQANGANPIPLIVPCHRVIGADGSLAGYAFGPETKRTLLEFEGVRISA